jgi:tetratricopeptide (TPR) repeat protein
MASWERHHAHWAAQGLQLVAVSVDEDRSNSVQSWIRDHHVSFPVLPGTDDVAGIYNIFYRYMFDRHRDMTLPTLFLIDGTGDVVKIYQGSIDFAHVERDIGQIPATLEERLAKALPFVGVDNTFQFGRNNLSYGSVFFQSGYLDQAAVSFRKALQDDPASAEALYGLGSVYLSQEKRTEARASFEAATTLQSGYPDTLPNAWNNLGLLATREGDMRGAIAYFKKALELKPAHFVALENLGNAYRQQKQWNDARETLKKALAVNPNDAEANYSLGMVFAQTNDNDSAYEYLRRALVLRPIYSEALNNLGVLYLRTGRRDEAVANFEECIRNAPDFDQSYLNLAQVYFLEDQPAKAREILLELLKRQPDNVSAQRTLERLPK